MKKSVKILYLDLETTGLYSRRHGIIQIAGIIEIDGNIAEEFNFKVKPFEEDEVVEKALEVNKTSEAEIKLYEDPKEVFFKFITKLSKHVNRFDKNDKFHIIGYKIDFDTSFLREYFKKNLDKFYGSYFYSNSVDVMDLCSDFLMSERHLLKDFKLGTVYGHIFNKEIPEDLHDAFADIKYTRELYKKVRPNR